MRCLSQTFLRQTEVGDAAAPAIDRDRLLKALNENDILGGIPAKVDLQTGRAIGAEALARWHTPEFGDGLAGFVHSPG